MVKTKGIRLPAIALVVLVAGTALAAAPAEARRVALIVGIGDYQHLAPLANPVSDAKALAEVLRRHGFTVRDHYNPARAELLDVLEAFREEARQATAAVVYYAGHGMNVAGQDILAPRDMEVTCEPKTARRAVPIEKLFEAVAGAPNQIVLLDACRNDPFPQCATRSARAGTGFLGLARGTAVDSSLLIANATLTGQLAFDGQSGQHSPFAAALLGQFAKNPRLLIRDLLDLVAAEVRKTTNGAQIPEVTARGGAPRLCLGGEGCGDFQTVAAPVPPGSLKPPAHVLPPGALEHPVRAIFRDCETCPEMVVLPAGEFQMGAPADEPGRQPSEGPQLLVRIARPIAVGKFEISFDEWEACLLDGGCRNHRPGDANWGRGRRPAINVSWDDAKAYIEWLRHKTGKAYRLPSEAEWEYAARAGTTTAFATGRTITAKQANFDGKSGVRPGAQRGDYLGRTEEVVRFPHNPFGLHDMHGNVAEWVEDCWNPSHDGAPDNGSARGGDCTRRVVRGGAWYYEAAYARSAARMSHPHGARLQILGFRVARPLE